MNSPFVKTILLALLAALVSGVAATFYPWPERVVESEMVGKPLFESYDTSAVFKIRIIKFDPDKNALNQIVLERSGEKWTIPAHNKFVANNSTQIAVVAKSLNELTVLSEESSDSQAFLDKGVVDPSKYESTTNRSALGTKLILEDHKGRRVASLIVGSSLNDEDTAIKNHFVRVPGQPTVYQVEFNKPSLTTDFTSWVNADLLSFSQRAPAFGIPGLIGINDYRIAPDALINGEQPKQNYLAQFEFAQAGMRLVSISNQSETGELQVLAPDEKLASGFETMGSQIVRILFHDVKKKKSALAKAMRKPMKSVDDSVFETLKGFGFVKKGFKDKTFDFEAVGGEVFVRHTDGVKVTIYIGDVAKDAVSDSLRVSLHVMVCVGVDESVFPMPEKPEDPQDKEYLRQLKQRDDAIKAATIRASALNQRHANWIYLVPEDVIENIRPDVDVSGAKPLVSDPVEVEKQTEPKVEIGKQTEPELNEEAEKSVPAEETADDKDAPAPEAESTEDAKKSD